MKQFTIITLLVLGATLQSQSILPHLDSIVQSRDTAALIEFCEQWHQDTKNCTATQIQNDTIREMYNLLESIFNKGFIKDYSKEENKPLYFVFQDNLILSVDSDEWDFENTVVEVELEKHKKRKTIVYTKTFRLGDVKESDFELYKKGFKKAFYPYSSKQTRVGQVYETFTEFCPTSGNALNDIKPCFLIGKYKAFSTIVGGLTCGKSYYFNQDNKPVMVDPSEQHYSNVAFIETVIGAQSEYRTSNAISRIVFNKSLNKAAIYPVLECATGYLPPFYEKVNGNWVFRGWYWDK